MTRQNRRLRPGSPVWTRSLAGSGTPTVHDWPIGSGSGGWTGRTYCGLPVWGDAGPRGVMLRADYAERLELAWCVRCWPSER